MENRTYRFTNTFPPSTELSLNVRGGEGTEEEPDGGDGLHRTTIAPSSLQEERDRRKQMGVIERGGKDSSQSLICIRQT